MTTCPPSPHVTGEGRDGVEHGVGSSVQQFQHLVHEPNGSLSGDFRLSSGPHPRPKDAEPAIVENKMIGPGPGTLERLLTDAADAYGLGAIESYAVMPSEDTANLVHRLTTDADDFAVKRFRYTASDSRWLETLVRGGDFEQAVLRSGHLVMPEPVRDRKGHIFALIPGPQGRIVVRVHRWLNGRPLPARPAPMDAVEAGAAQFRIQQIGKRFDPSREGALMWWRWDPTAVLTELVASDLIDHAEQEASNATLTEALDLVRAAERAADAWTYCHYDIKPANFLRTPDGLAVLDWDESCLCPPRQETVEAALLWGGYDAGGVDPDGFTAFIEGYCRAGGRLNRLDRIDFGKFIASAVGWFDYLGRCRLGEFPGSAAFAERPDPGQVLADIRHRLDCIDTWRAWL